MLEKVSYLLNKISRVNFVRVLSPNLRTLFNDVLPEVVEEGLVGHLPFVFLNYHQRLLQVPN